MKTIFEQGDVCWLVYQAGIANVFHIRGHKRTRISQGDFRTCENYTRGVAACGIKIMVAWCNLAGDISKSTWLETNFRNAPFDDKFAWDLINKQIKNL